MPIRVEAYLAGGTTSGTVEGPGHLRDLLETSSELALARASYQGLSDPAPSTVGETRIPIDDVLVVLSDDDPFLSMHAAWHPVELEAGPYAIRGELPTLPGFDPGRALTRPSGEFVLLRDVRLSLLDEPAQAIDTPHAFINRYGVDRVAADLMLGFFFPGAEMSDLNVRPPAGAAAPGPAPASS